MMAGVMDGIETPDGARLVMALGFAVRLRLGAFCWLG